MAKLQTWGDTGTADPTHRAEARDGACGQPSCFLLLRLLTEAKMLSVQIQPPEPVPWLLSEPSPNTLGFGD